MELIKKCVICNLSFTSKALERGWPDRLFHYISKKWNGDITFIVYSSVKEGAKRFSKKRAEQIVKDLHRIRDKKLEDYYKDGYTETDFKEGVMLITDDKDGVEKELKEKIYYEKLGIFS